MFAFSTQKGFGFENSAGGISRQPARCEMECAVVGFCAVPSEIASISFIFDLRNLALVCTVLNTVHSTIAGWLAGANHSSVRMVLLRILCDLWGVGAAKKRVDWKMVVVWMEFKRWIIFNGSEYSWVWLKLIDWSSGKRWPLMHISIPPFCANGTSQLAEMFRRWAATVTTN